MRTILITGMSGTGKSTLLGALAARGYRVADLDDDRWSVEVATADGAGLEQVWREDTVADLLAGSDAPHVVAGCASNQGTFYDRFGAVVLLSAPVGLLRERLRTRDTNGFGKAAYELERILHDVAEVEPVLRATSTSEIVTTLPPDRVADAVEAMLSRVRDASG